MASRTSTRERASGSMAAGSPAGTSAAQATRSSSVRALTSARPNGPMRGAAAAGDSRVPVQSGHVRSCRKRLTRARRRSSTARFSSSVTVRRALRKVKSSSCRPFFEVTAMCFFSAGPFSTISRSASVRSRQGTSVRTPNSRAINGCTLNPKACQGRTVPSSRLRPSSRMRVASSTSRTVPMP